MVGAGSGVLVQSLGTGGQVRKELAIENMMMVDSPGMIDSPGSINDPLAGAPAAHSLLIHTQQHIPKAAQRLRHSTLPTCALCRTMPPQPRVSQILAGWLSVHKCSHILIAEAGRGYDFSQVVKWYAERADVVFLFFDPDKPVIDCGLTEPYWQLIAHYCLG